MINPDAGRIPNYGSTPLPAGGNQDAGPGLPTEKVTIGPAADGDMPWRNHTQPHQEHTQPHQESAELPPRPQRIEPPETGWGMTLGGDDQPWMTYVENDRAIAAWDAQHGPKGTGTLVQLDEPKQQG